MNWKWEVFFDALPLVSKGIWITLGLTIACYIFAIVFGFFWVIVRNTPFKFVNWIFTWILEFIRSTPPLVQLYFIYYAWPVMPVGSLTLTAFQAAVIGLGLHTSTYISEVYRSGIESVDKGQWEASTALNFTTSQKWFKVILPQAVPPIIPMLGNYFIILLKEVPLTSTIGVLGILALANNYGSAHFRYLEALTIVALIFLALSYPASLFINYLEKKMNRRFDKSSPTGSSPM